MEIWEKMEALGFHVYDRDDRDMGTVAHCGPHAVGNLEKFLGERLDPKRGLVTINLCRPTRLELAIGGITMINLATKKQYRIEKCKAKLNNKNVIIWTFWEAALQAF